jgi:hypothetical protein
VNFLFDKTQKPSMTVADLCAAFGATASTMSSKSRAIRTMFQMHQLDPAWTLPSRIADNPLAWMIEVNGFAIDARFAPLEIQQEAYRRGMIPFLPGNPRNDRGP